VTIQKPPLIIKAQTAVTNKKKYGKNNFQYGRWNYYTLQCGTIMKLILPGDHPAMWRVALGWHAIEFALMSTILEFYFCFWFRPYHSVPVYEILSKSDHPQQKKWCRIDFCRAMLCIAQLLPSHGVRPSVCASVTFVSCAKMNKDILEIFSPSGSDTIQVFPYQRGCRYSDGNPPNGGIECKGYDKMPIFSQISRCISETVILRWAHAARQFVSIWFSFHPYNI